MMRLAVFAFALVAGLAGAALAQNQSSITVTEAWARATPKGAQTGAAYVTLANKGMTEDKLLSANTPVAAEAQLHTTITDNGVMKMRPLSAIEVKPGAAVAMKPGGMHLMLMGLKQPLSEGQSFPLSLTFEKAGTIETKVTVAKAGAMTGMDMGGMNDMDMGDMKTK
jgi:periplasmic copper chaperone A